MSLHDLLVEASDIIERNVTALRQCHTIGGQWPESEAEVKGAYEYEMDTVQRLREAARIFDPTNWKIVRSRTVKVENDRRRKNKNG